MVRGFEVTAGVETVNQYCRECGRHLNLETESNAPGICFMCSGKEKREAAQALRQTIESQQKAIDELVERFEFIRDSIVDPHQEAEPEELSDGN